ncbi:MAG: ribosomal protein S18-alanine N-acetyltransferase [Gemmatimonadota bacterium]|nr:ribosomal protein S18-alanine N-acetyltransferase [Gemmatimonadota bacterium]MDE3172631.1 ribosomal protein S18-alanine N-acetyltransferase [Gemmatimonadota bacterium]MDE3217040.1 ribosomal protein S18-alanine N-acetyltransferase [Gemmatimonadota bacterium]
MTAAIGPVTLADTQQVSAIEAAVFADPWSANSFRSLHGDPRVFFACAREPGDGAGSTPGVVPGAADRVLGYVVAIFAADEGEIANLAVAPDAQGRGLGGGLLDAALAEAERRGARVLYLEVRESNHAARALYRSRRFEEAGRRRGYYRRPVEDALLLRRIVEPRLK